MSVPMGVALTRSCARGVARPLCHMARTLHATCPCPCPCMAHLVVVPRKDHVLQALTWRYIQLMPELAKPPVKNRLGLGLGLGLGLE